MLSNGHFTLRSLLFYRLFDGWNSREVKNPDKSRLAYDRENHCSPLNSSLAS
jgi:hypothetical protein